ncbi:hypothetical protein ACOMHN_017877 [Nucella lapillus]
MDATQMPPERSGNDHILVEKQPPWENRTIIPHPYTKHPGLYYILTFCSHIIVPVIIFTGIIGNILAFFVFVFSSLKRLPMSVYLASLAFVDCSFLLCLGAGWLDNFRFSFFKQEVVCTCVVYMTYVFSFLSVWFVVCFTMDMYLTLFHEALAARINYVSKARFVVCSLALLSGCLYLHAFWTIKQVMSTNDEETCIFQADDEFRMAVAITDSILTLLLPYTLLIFMNTRILLVIIGFSRPKRRGDHPDGAQDSPASPREHRLQPITEMEESEMAMVHSCSSGEGGVLQPVTCETNTALSESRDISPSPSRKYDGRSNSGFRRSATTRNSRKSSRTPKDTNASSDCNDVTWKRSSFDDDAILSSFETEEDLYNFDFGLDGMIIRVPKKRKTMHRKITDMQWKSFKMLLTVAMIFLILNLPSHAIRLQGLIRFFFSPNYVTSETEHLCQQFFQVL